jgi:hypothetical protein
MSALAKDFRVSKATWTGIAAIIASAAGWYAGSLTPQEAIIGIFAALQTIWIRDTLAKGNEHTKIVGQKVDNVAGEVSAVQQTVAGTSSQSSPSSTTEWTPEG